MTEPTIPELDDETDDFPIHTCACGEQHRHRPGSPSNREVCTSPKKNTDACCCGSANSPQGNNHRCGQGRSHE
ncbi:MAG TPA: hypothetical protein VJ350_05000 [Methanoregula sp.]|nr:hypothetical protein [Methanoregula sp.]